MTLHVTLKRHSQRHIFRKQKDISKVHRAKLTPMGAVPNRTGPSVRDVSTRSRFSDAVSSTKYFCLGVSPRLFCGCLTPRSTAQRVAQIGQSAPHRHQTVYQRDQRRSPHYVMRYGPITIILRLKIPCAKIQLSKPYFLNRNPNAIPNGKI